MTAATESPTPVLATGPRHRFLVSAFATAVVVVAFVGILPSIADYSHVGRVLGEISGTWLLAVVGAFVLNQVVDPISAVVMLRHLSYRHALATRLASTAAANAIPGGGAVGVGFTYRMLSSWGHKAADITAMVAATGIWGKLVRLALPVAALLVALVYGDPSRLVVAAAATGFGVLVGLVLAAALVLRSPLRGPVVALGIRVVGWGRRMGRREIDAPGIAGGRGARFSSAVSEHWGRLVVATVASNLTLFLVLLVSLRAVGVSSSLVGWTEVLGAFAIVRLITAVPITPGGVGVAEVGLTAFLSRGLVGPVVGQIVAAVLLFRFLTYVLPTPAGGIVALKWKRDHRSWVIRGLDSAAVVPSEDLEETECFRCGLAGRRVYDLAPFALVECPRCGIAFMSPRLSGAGRARLYGDVAYFDEGVYPNGMALRLQRTWVRGRLDLLEFRGEARTLLEVGCAYGLFLEEAARRGFDVVGLEYSPVAAATAAGRLDITVHGGEIVDLDPDQPFDVVAAWDVIEHVADPRAFLGAAHRLLNPGGVLALSCPYFDSLPARLLGRRWWNLKPHKHIWHFEVAQLRRLLAESGFEVVKLVRSPFHPANRRRFDSVVVVARRGQHPPLSAG